MAERYTAEYFRSRRMGESYDDPFDTGAPALKGYRRGARLLGDLRRNPSVPLQAVLTDTVGAPFYASTGGAAFGSTFCAPIPPEETNANPNF